jgi:ABC-2 type transport system permease protein
VKSWTVLSVKEFRESWRSFKLLWMPLLFLFLGVSDPLSNYYMEDLLAAVGNMPEGFQIVLPDMQATDLLLASINQFQLIGVIVLIAVFIGTISRERSNGTATLVYVRPVAPASIYMSKWMNASLVALWSAVWGFAGSIYYTSILYGSIPLLTALVTIATYALWLLFVMALTVTMSAAFSTAVGVALTIVLIPIGGMVDSILGTYWYSSPWKLAYYGVLINEEAVSLSHYWSTLLVTVALIIVVVVTGIWATGRNRQLTQV